MDISHAFSDLNDYFKLCLEEIRSKDTSALSKYAENHRWLFNEGGGHVGRWDGTIAPYLNEPMDCLNSLKFLTVCISGSGQSGKTSVAENWLQRSVEVDPGDFLWFMQSDESLKAYVKTRINPMIDAHPTLLNSLGSAPTDVSLHYKKFHTMDVEFLSATKKNLINKSAPRIVADEIDAYPPMIGNVKPLLDVRRQTYGIESMLLIVSHPDLARGMTERDWTDGVMSVYADSDRRMWYAPCPHCSAWSSPCPGSERFMYIDYPHDGTLDEVQEQAVLICPVNGCIVEEKDRMKMMRQGKWVAMGQEIKVNGEIVGEPVNRDIAGFWMVAAMSPFILGGIGGLARARVKAEREWEISGDDKTLKEVMVKQWGYPYVPPRQIGSVSAAEIVERVDHNTKLKVVPHGVRFLTAAVDIQLSYFDVLVRGWGIGGESWIVDRFRIGGSPADTPDDWDKMIPKLLKVAYPLQDEGAYLMPIRGVGFDSGGMPGVTRQAYDAWTRWHRQQLVKKYGIIHGREVWSAIPLKGASSINAKKLSVSYPDTSGNKDRAASKGDVPVGMFNPNLFKDDLAGQLQRSEEGNWYVHFPPELRSREEPHEFFEGLVAEQRLPNGRWEKKNRHTRNEPLDLMVMNHIVAHLHGISSIKWDNPPNWAKPWKDNSFVVKAENVASADKKDNNTSDSDGVKIITQSVDKSKNLVGKLA